MENLGDALGTKLINQETLEIIKDKIQYLNENPPNTICVNVVLTGSAALKHAICKEIIKNTANVSDQDADWYIVCAGAERELVKLVKLGAQNIK